MHLAIVTALLLGGPPPAADAGPPPTDFQAQIVERLRVELRDPESMRDLQVCDPTRSRSGWSAAVVVNARNGFGGYSGRQYLIALFKDGRLDSVVDPRMGPTVTARLLADTTECDRVPTDLAAR